jgi:HK97 gp10 family phage protein
MAKFVRGTAELRRSFNDLKRHLAVPLNQAGRESLRVTLAEARRNAPVDDGDLKKALAIRRDDANSTPLAPKFKVGVRSDYRGVAGRRPIRYAHLIEFGVSPHPLKGGAQHPGTRANPFMRQAFEATKKEVIARVGKYLGPAIERRAARLAKKVR